MERIFHPIGQGAFYSERHTNYNIVYDCGNWKNTNLSSRVVKQSFGKGEIIDLLFISHFDADHVNKICILKEHCKIRVVVMPLLHEEEKILLANLYKVLGETETARIVESAQEYFDDGTQVIFINPNENGENRNDFENYPIDTILSRRNNDRSAITLDSVRLVPEKLDWCFIPYNYCRKERNIELEKQFKTSGLDIDLFQNDLDYALSKKKIVHDIYDSLSGKINQNSMLVYSGPLNSTFSLTHISNLFSLRYYLSMIGPERVACIYTGDSDLNKMSLQSIFNADWNLVGTIQVPHHGDIKCFSGSFLDGQPYICPISFGLTNSYAHPSSRVISKIIARDGYPVYVTEDFRSTYVQVITKS